MSRRYHLFVAILASLVIVSASSCSKKTKPEDQVSATANSDENPTGDSDSGKAMGLQTVHFPYDSFGLNSEAKGVLKDNAGILKAHSSLKIQVEGHCDERGGIQYNIALGEKRANAVKEFLVDGGVKADRITTISFGKERPLDAGHTEAAYAKNRRANFVITSR
jgi:peptidoglycan-associated lipoprotein